MHLFEGICKNTHKQAKNIINVLSNFVFNDICMTKIARNLVAKGVKIANHDLQITQGKKPSKGNKG